MFESGIGFDSALYASLSRELSRSFSFWNVPWHQEYFSAHPPLVLWLNSILYRLLPATDVTARLLNVFFALGILLMIYKLGSLLVNRRFAFFAALSFALTQHVLAIAASSFLDVGCSFFGICFVYLCLRYLQTGLLLHLSLISASLFLSFFSKGLFALLPLSIGLGPVVFGFFPVRRVAFAYLAGFVSVALVMLYFLLQREIGAYDYLGLYLHEHLLTPGHTGQGVSYQFGMLLEYFQMAFPFNFFALLGVIICFVPSLSNIPKFTKVFLVFSFFLSFLFFSVSSRNLSFYLMAWYPYHALCSGAFLYSVCSLVGKFTERPWYWNSVRLQRKVSQGVFALALAVAVVLHWLPIRVRSVSNADIYFVTPIIRDLKTRGISQVITIGNIESKYHLKNYGWWYWDAPVQFYTDPRVALEVQGEKTKRSAFFVDKERSNEFLEAASGRDYVETQRLKNYFLYVPKEFFDDDLQGKISDKRQLR